MRSSGSAGARVWTFSLHTLDVRQHPPGSQRSHPQGLGTAEAGEAQNGLRKSRRGRPSRFRTTLLAHVTERTCVVAKPSQQSTLCWLSNLSCRETERYRNV